MCLTNFAQIKNQQISFFVNCEWRHEKSSNVESSNEKSPKHINWP